jgi:hypothetical protein
MNPRNSLRKVLGLYEHELNCWLEAVLPNVSRVLDVGANDGYFTFGCMAAFRRMRKVGEVIAFEPEQQHFETLQKTLEGHTRDVARITLVNALVGSEISTGVTTLDQVRWKAGSAEDRTETLVKIDVEGSELDVLKGSTSWINPSNYFLIEVHEASFLNTITDLFNRRGLNLTRVAQRPLPLLGNEKRKGQNWWLVSERPKSLR